MHLRHFSIRARLIGLVSRHLQTLAFNAGRYATAAERVLDGGLDSPVAGNRLLERAKALIYEADTALAAAESLKEQSRRLATLLEVFRLQPVAVR